MEAKSNLFMRTISMLWRIINNTRKLFLNLIFFVIIIAIIVSSGSKQEIKAPNEAALVLNIQGSLVEQKKSSNPLDELTKDVYGQAQNTETLVSDVIEAIELLKMIRT